MHSTNILAITMIKTLDVCLVRVSVHFSRPQYSHNVVSGPILFAIKWLELEYIPEPIMKGLDNIASVNNVFFFFPFIGCTR